MMIECTRHMRDDWEDRSPDEPIDVNEEMKHLTMAIVGKTLLGVDLKGEYASWAKS
jgi:cytochrome P450